MKLKLKTKLILVIFSLSFLSTSIISFFGIQLTKGLISENSEIKLDNIHSNSQMKIQEVVTYSNFILDSLEHEVYSYINNSADINSSIFWESTLSKLSHSFENVGNMSVFSHTSYIFIDPVLTGLTHELYFADMNNDGRVELQNIIGKEYFNEDPFNYPYYKSWWFQTKNTLKQTWSLPYDWTHDNNKTIKYISITRPIIVNNTFVGIIGTDIQYEKLATLLKESNYPEYNFLINSENQILVHPSYKLNQFINYENEDIFFNIVNEKFDELFETEENEEGSYYILSRLSNQWIIGTSFPESSVIWTIHDNLFRVNTILIIILILNIPISYKLGSIIASPLVKISENINNYNFKHPRIINDNRILKRNDEIGYLASSMNLMASNLFGNILKLKEQNETLEEEISTKILFKEQLDLVNSVIENSNDGIFILNYKKELVFSNKSLRNLLLIPDDLPHKRNFVYEYFDINDKLFDNLLNNQNLLFEHNYTSNEGEKIFLSLSIRVLRGPSDDTDNTKFFMGIIKNISIEKKHQNDLDYITKYDDLTELPNKEYFEEKALDYIVSNQANNPKCSLITLNIVEFRIINEIFGYDAGNNILKSVKDTIVDQIKDNGIISRTTGDEFSIFIFDFNSLEYVTTLIDNLYNRFNLPYRINNKDVYIQIYMGISLLPYDSTTFEELQRHSLSAINHVKEISKTGYEFYYDKMSLKSKRKYDNITSLKQSIQGNNIINHYQAIMNLETNKIEGFESLVRIKDKDKIVYPNEFISLAEETNLIIPLGKIIIKNSFKFLKNLLSISDDSYTMNINISYKQFEDNEFVSFLRKMLKEYELSPSMIILELTEGTLIKNLRMSKLKIKELEKLGITIAIDDFGTGYSALGYLNEFDIRKIKIDMSFIRNYPENDDGKLIKNIESLAKDLDITTIVEGVETKEQLDYIKSIGCIRYQGYFLSKPVSEDKVLELI